MPDPTFPEMRTAKQQGYNFGLDLWRGIAVLRGTPRAVIARLEDAVRKAVESPEFREAAARIGFMPAYLSSAAFTRMIAEDDAQVAAVLKLLRR